jgi:DNA ligase-4
LVKSFFGRARSEGDPREEDCEGWKMEDNANDAEDSEDEDEDDVPFEDEFQSHVDEEQEPAYTYANSLSFSQLCERMNHVWNLRINKKGKIYYVDKLLHLLPPKLIADIEPESLYPILRLLLPDMDNSRNTCVKEKLIATMYTDALCLKEGSVAYKKLFDFTNPQNNQLADLSVAVEEVLNEDRAPCNPSKITVGKINDMMDKLCQIRRNTTTRQISLRKLRANWMLSMRHQGLSPLEHKWLVRIMLNKMEMGLGWRTVLRWYRPDAVELWNAHNSLKAVCNKICRVDFRRYEGGTDLSSRHELLASYMPRSSAAIAINQMFAPMLSKRSSFESVLYDLSDRHATFLKEGEFINDAAKSLACSFPTFCVEVKLDGERMIVHIHDGIVRMHTRNSRWYR